MSTPSLYVDVDDTLLRWITDDSYEVSHEVLRFIEGWRGMNPGGRLVIWSTGGKDHAEKAAALYVPEPYVCMSKQPLQLKDGDLSVDDDPLLAHEAFNIHPMDLN